MDVKEYIESGIIERFVFDDVTDQERQEVQCLSKIYPEIGGLVLSYTQGLEKLARKTSIEPPSEIKHNVLTQIKQTNQDAVIDNETNQAKEGKVIPFNAKLWKGAVAACLIGLVFTFAVLIRKTSDLDTKEVHLSQKNQEIEVLKEQNQLAENKNQQVTKYLEFVKNDQTKLIKLSATTNYPNQSVKVFWNSETKEVLLEQVELAGLTSQQQYQLWAIVDGKPVDLGVFDTELNTLNYYKEVSKPQAFAITIEPRGGSVTPTLEKMVVIGNVGT